MRRVTESQPIAVPELRALARERFGDMIKGVVDLAGGILVLDADMHADEEADLLADGSTQADCGASTSILTWPGTTGWNSIP